MERATHLILKVEERRAGAAPVAVIAGTAVAKGAVARNRARRRVRAVLREAESRYHGLRVVAVLRRSALTLSFPELRAEVEQLLTRALARVRRGC
ncbi:MAG: ribonuclease P protein component [Candidatus Jorgensenbacteria bacterium]